MMAAFSRFQLRKFLFPDVIIFLILIGNHEIIELEYFTGENLRIDEGIYI